MASSDAGEWAKACNAEVARHTDDLNTWTLEEQLAEGRPLPYVMTFRSKTNQYGGLKKHKVRCDIRGDRIRSGLDFDGTITASHMPSQSGRRMLLAAAAAEGYVVESWDVPGLYMNAPNYPRFRATMKQPTMAYGS